MPLDHRKTWESEAHLPVRGSIISKCIPEPANARGSRIELFTDVSDKAVRWRADAKTDDGKTARDMATERGHKELAEKLGNLRQ